MWIPEQNYKYPTNNKRNLKFQHHWLYKWTWIAYSKMFDGVLCKYCVIFNEHEGGSGSQKLGKFVLTPFSNWKHAIEEFNKHDNNKYHKMTLLKFDCLMSVSNKTTDSILIQLDKKLKSEIEQNRAKLKPIIETVMFCGRQGLPLRGHRDSGPINCDNPPVENDGNFRSLLRFKVMSGDINLAEHLKTAQGNASYTSADIQNQILTSCSNLILKQIISKVNAAKCFTVLADETADISGIEQFSLCVRYFEFSSMQMREDFLTFVPVTDVIGMGLANTLLNTLDKLGIDLKYLRGQGFDGAATMSGCFNGVQSHVTKKYPLAHYIHCTSHCLNLAISDTCNIQSIRNCTGTIQKVCVFFKYPKRQNVMLDSIKRVCPESQITKLKLLCPTRWVDRHDSIITFMELFDAVIDGLSIISTWPDRESSSGAYQLLCAIKQPEFILATHLLAKVFSISLPLSKLLQMQNIDLIEAMSLADNVSDVLKNIRNNADEDFKKLFLKVKEKCMSLDIEITLPRLTNIQKNRFNVKTTCSNEYYKISLFIPFLDNFISQLHDRFIEHKSLITNFCCLLPNNNLPNREENIKSLAEKYSEDLQCSSNSVIGEVLTWTQKFVGAEKPKNALEALIACNPLIFPSTYKLLQIIATLPVTTASSERSFSTLKRLKTYLRNTIGENRLNSLALLNIHREIILTTDEVLNDFAKDSRKIRLL